LEPQTTRPHSYPGAGNNTSSASHSTHEMHGTTSLVTTAGRSSSYSNPDLTVKTEPKTVHNTSSTIPMSIPFSQAYTKLTSDVQLVSTTGKPISATTPLITSTISRPQPLQIVKSSLPTDTATSVASPSYFPASSMFQHHHQLPISATPLVISSPLVNQGTGTPVYPFPLWSAFSPITLSPQLSSVNHFQFPVVNGHFAAMPGHAYMQPPVSNISSMSPLLLSPTTPKSIYVS